MAYYFMVNDKRGSFKRLDISCCSLFVRMSRFKGEGLSLQEFDAFTSCFNDIDELKAYLINNNVLSIEHLDKNLSIRNLIRGDYDKVPYDFLYQKDIDYIFNPKKLVRDINSKLEEEDFNFIAEFVKHFKDHHECSTTSLEVNQYNKDSIRLGYKSRYFNLLDENLDNPLERMVKLLIYRYSQGNDGILRYSDELKYRNFHDVIAFLNNYDKQNNKTVCENVEVPNRLVDIKRRVRTKEPMEGQISIYDILK